MYEKILKYVIYFWGFVFIVFGMKFLTSNADMVLEAPHKLLNKLNEIKKDIDLKQNDLYVMYLDMHAKKGVTIDGVSACKDTTHPLVSSMHSSCWNGECSIQAEFKNEIPKMIDLKVKVGLSKNCVLQTFEVEKNIETVGYRVELIFDEVTKRKLHIDEDVYEIAFSQSIGYSRTEKNGVTHIVFDFEEPLKEDFLVVKSKEKYLISFTLK